MCVHCCRCQQTNVLLWYHSGFVVHRGRGEMRAWVRFVFGRQSDVCVRVVFLCSDVINVLGGAPTWAGSRTAAYTQSMPPDSGYCEYSCVFQPFGRCIHKTIQPERVKVLVWYPPTTYFRGVPSNPVGCNADSTHLLFCREREQPKSA